MTQLDQQQTKTGERESFVSELMVRLKDENNMLRLRILALENGCTCAPDAVRLGCPLHDWKMPDWPIERDDGAGGAPKSWG